MNSLGKYGQYPDCVDFDPSHEINAKAESEMPNFSQLQSEIGDFATERAPIRGSECFQFGIPQ